MATEEKKNLSAKEQLIEDLKTKEEQGMEVTKAWTSMWSESLRYFFSDQLHGKILHEDWDWVIVNYIWPSAMQEISKLAKNYPKILAHPYSDDDADYAEIWQSALQWAWENALHHEGMRMQQIRACLAGKLFGYRVSKVFWEPRPENGWDEEKQQWMGDVQYRLWHPSEFWASDKEYIQDGDCGTVRYVDLDWAISRWPDYKKQFTEKATSYKDIISSGNRTIRGQLSSYGTYPSTGRGGVDKGVRNNDPTLLLNLVMRSDRMSARQTQDERDRRFVKISETYFKDYEEESIEQTEDIPANELLQTQQAFPDGNGGILDASGASMTSENWPQRTSRKYKRPKYPKGRYIIRCEDTILNEDKKSQVYPYTMWPFVVTPHYLLPFMWQGTDCVQMYKTSQDMINVTVSHLVNNMKQYGDPRVAVEKGAIDVQPGRKKRFFKIFSGAGSIIRLAKGAISGKKFMVIPPANLSSGNIQLYQLFAQEYKNICGLQDIAEGLKSPGEMTATQANYLAISANDRIFLQSIFEDRWVLGVAQLTAEVMQKNYDIDRYFRIVGEENIIGLQQMNQKLKSLKFDVNIEPGQTLPFDEDKREARYEKAYAMLNQPMVNVMLPEMMRIYKISNWKKILQKHEAWVLFTQFHQLYEAVAQQKITPEQAIQIIVNKAQERFKQQQQSIEGIAARNLEKGEFDKKQLNIDRQKGEIEVEKTILNLEKKAAMKEISLEKEKAANKNRNNANAKRT